MSLVKIVIPIVLLFFSSFSVAVKSEASACNTDILQAVELEDLKIHTPVTWEEASLILSSKLSQNGLDKSTNYQCLVTILERVATPVIKKYWLPNKKLSINLDRLGSHSEILKLDVLLTGALMILNDEPLDRKFLRRQMFFSKEDSIYPDRKLACSVEKKYGMAEVKIGGFHRNLFVASCSGTDFGYLWERGWFKLDAQLAHKVCNSKESEDIHLLACS